MLSQVMGPMTVKRLVMSASYCSSAELGAGMPRISTSVRTSRGFMCETLPLALRPMKSTASSALGTSKSFLFAFARASCRDSSVLDTWIMHQLLAASWLLMLAQNSKRFSS